MDEGGHWREVRVIADSPMANYAFDVTPARLVTGLITEYGLFSAQADELTRLHQILNPARENQ